VTRVTRVKKTPYSPSSEHSCYQHSAEHSARYRALSSASSSIDYHFLKKKRSGRRVSDGNPPAALLSHRDNFLSCTLSHFLVSLSLSSLTLAHSSSLVSPLTKGGLKVLPLYKGESVGVDGVAIEGGRLSCGKTPPPTVLPLTKGEPEGVEFPDGREPTSPNPSLVRRGTPPPCQGGEPLAHSFSAFCIQ
jgi:hypothetical protein